ITMTYPVEVKGLSVLNWTYLDPKRDQDVWLWIPSLKKVRKISASQSDDSFMGSDLTVQEVSTRKFEDETYKLLESKAFAGYKFEHTGEMLYVGKPVFVIEARPVRANWYYAKRLVYVDRETGGAVYSEYYDKNDKMFKTDFLKWDLVPVADGRQFPAQTGRECKDLRTGHRTVIMMHDTTFDTGLSEELFTEKALARSRW
ncbi:MAG: outer membrane lipoprotein-sorting protein, partial [Candidatus Omnitrophica bacterium]|nr:outer membrane lipoprotein-sorting protein [Candidatus Omnitrophota bacterium]